MKTIIITKETDDIRPGRTKTLGVGTEMTCLDDLADEYLKKKLAKLKDEPIKPKKKPLKSIKDVEDYEMNYELDKDNE